MCRRGSDEPAAAQTAFTTPNPDRRRLSWWGVAALALLLAGVVAARILG